MLFNVNSSAHSDRARFDMLSVSSPWYRYGLRCCVAWHGPVCPVSYSVVVVWVRRVALTKTRGHCCRRRAERLRRQQYRTSTTMIDYRVWAGVLVRCIEDMEANDEYLVPSSNRIGPEHYLPFELEIFLHFFLYSGPSALIFGL